MFYYQFSAEGILSGSKPMTGNNAIEMLIDQEHSQNAWNS